jgi:hypothetical protein
MPDKTLLTAGHARDILAEVFPGAEVKVTDRLGGTVAEVAVWLFTIEASVTADLIGLKDSLGEARLTFVFRPPKLRATLIRQATVADEEGVRAFVLGCREYLQGIAAAIAVACDPA